MDSFYFLESKKDRSDRKHRRSHSHSESGGGGEIPHKRSRSKKEELETALRKRNMEATNTMEEWEVDGVAQLEIKLSPSPYKEPPTEDDLLQMIKVLTWCLFFY